MKEGRYFIADTAVLIRSVYDEVQELCKDYKTDKECELTIETNQADIDFEREKSKMEEKLEGLIPYAYADSYLETLAVYRKLVVELLKKDILLFHGSVVAVDGVGYLFTAKSGTGKSTHTALWRKKFGDRAEMINDDKPLILLQNGEATVYGTPWDGKHHLSVNKKVPLKTICILERAKENQIKKISMKEALAMLFQQAYRPNNKADMELTMRLIQKLGNSVGLYRLGCNMQDEAATVAYNGMV